MKKHPNNDSGQCRKCGGKMIRSVALETTLVGIPDFSSDTHAITLSAGGTGRRIPCLKCEKCGWSISA